MLKLDRNRCSKMADVTIPYSNISSIYNIGGTAKFGLDRDRCSKIADVTIPYSNTSRSTTHSWFVSSSILVPTKNAKSLTPLFKGTAKFGQDWDWCSKMADVTIPYSNTIQSTTHSWFVYFSTLVPTRKIGGYFGAPALTAQCAGSLNLMIS